MKEIEIYAKGSLTHEQLDVKESIGCDGLEVQLLGELIKDRTKGHYYSPLEVFDLSALSRHNIKVVHAPLLPGEGDILLEALCDTKDIKLLDGVFYIANYFGQMQNRKCVIVLHSESFYEKLIDVSDAYKNIAKVLDSLLSRYPYTEVVIENVSPLRGIGKGKELHLANNFAFDNIVLVEKLREDLKTDRIGTCLDTCHAMLSYKYITAMYKLVGDVPVPDLAMRVYFERNASLCKLIHLSDIAGSGYGKGRHGVPFKDATYDKLVNIMDLYHEYEYTCPITLEVEETDYAICDGYRVTKELIDKYLQRG